MGYRRGFALLFAIFVLLMHFHAAGAEETIADGYEAPSEGRPNFAPPHEKCDLLVVAAHQADEFICFGGLIPYYTLVRGKKVQVVYMTDGGPGRRDEAADGLWAVGMRNAPDFINFPEERVETIKKGVELWGGKEAILAELVARIRRFQPEVIVTHDLDGESGHNQHKITANAMKLAISAAADPAQYADSAIAYGTWQVKKLYLHLYSEGVINFDWNAPDPALNDATPLKMARAGYAKHVSQQEYDGVHDGGMYDNALFGLAYTVVSEDARREDLFENIDPEEPPAPTNLSTPEPALYFSPEPNFPAPEGPHADGMAEAHAGRIALVLGGGIALIGALSGAQAILYARRKRRK